MNQIPPINGYLEAIRLKHHLPAMACAVVTSNGLADVGVAGVRKAGSDIQATAEDLWHLGSDTKAMTAAMIGALLEQKKISLNESIEHIFPKLAPSLSQALRQVTLLHLLSHRAGLPENISWRNLVGQGSLHEQRLAVLMALGPLVTSTEPEMRYGYSNVGYVVAAAMAEEVMGQSWETLMNRMVFSPLQMSTAGFGGIGAPGKINQPWPHLADGTPAPKNGPDADNPPVMGPSGTVHCSISDWAKFVADQLRGFQRKPALLKSETYQMLHCPSFGGNYAGGWLVTPRSQWGYVYTHAGSNTMNYALAWMAPTHDLSVLVCVNQGGIVAARACTEVINNLRLRYG